MSRAREARPPTRQSWGHPRGVQPTANMILAGSDACRKPGLGRLAVLDDSLLLQILELLPYRELGRLAVVGRALYCFANHDDLWKALVIEEIEEGFDFSNSWKETFLLRAVPDRKVSGRPPVCVSGVYSDLLYQPWFLGSLAIDSDWLEADTIARRSNLTVDEFRRDFELPNLPVVLKGAAGSWPAIHKWDDQYLRCAFRGNPVLAGEYPMSFDQYLKYAESTTDEMPLYLFDKNFLDKAPALKDDFAVPEYFAEDLFSLLGENGRPDYRWIIMGPEKSGSTFHKDPNSTSAWNAVIRGSKKWILYPPSVAPPGVHASTSGADVVTSVSLMEWFVNFYTAPGSQGEPSQGRPVEGVVEAGDIIFVPRGWWHMAINLEPTVAITQNYVSSANLPYVLRFLRSGRADLVSGCSANERAGLHNRFVEVLQKHAPDTLAAAEEVEAENRRRLAEQSRLSSLFTAGDCQGNAPSLSMKDTDKTRGFEFDSVHSDSTRGPSCAGGGFAFNFDLGNVDPH